MSTKGPPFRFRLNGDESLQSLKVGRIGKSQIGRRGQFSAASGAESCRHEAKGRVDSEIGRDRFLRRSVAPAGHHPWVDRDGVLGISLEVSFGVQDVFVAYAVHADVLIFFRIALAFQEQIRDRITRQGFIEFDVVLQ